MNGQKGYGVPSLSLQGHGDPVFTASEWFEETVTLTNGGEGLDEETGKLRRYQVGKQREVLTKLMITRRDCGGGRRKLGPSLLGLHPS